MGMAKSHLPLNALRAFEASARHLSFTKAGMELRLGFQLFRRLPRGLALTDEGQALIPAIADSFGRLRATLERFEKGHFRGVVSIGVVGTFATGWLLPRLPSFREVHPFDTAVTIGSYWLTSLKSKAETDAMRAFRLWIVAAAQAQKS